MAALEWVRPLVNNKPWEYCVIWRLGDDPSSGGNINIKDEDDVIGECKDKLVKHSIRTNACKKLAQLPSVIPLYSGIHGDVVISKQPRWIAQSNASASDSEGNGTQVLVPVPCGLIELFSTKHVPKDEKVIDYISARFEFSAKQEDTNERAHTDFGQLSDYQESWYPSLHYLNYLPQKTYQPNNYSSFEGSSTCTSSLSNDHQLLKVGSDSQVFESISREKSSREYMDSPRRQKIGVKNRHKPVKGPYKSKNLETERNRRKRIKDGMFALRALVPKISKMDRAATLGDAADYIKELKETIENYQDELKAMEEEEEHNKVVNDTPYLTNLDKKLCGDSQKTQIEVHVEVSQLGTKDFLLKLICNQKRGGFSRLMEAIDALGLQVIDANVTTLHGSVLNVLKVEANRTEVEANALKQSLIQLVK